MHRGAILGVCLVALAGCRADNTQKLETDYQLKGTIVASDPGKGEVTVNGQPIPGYMEAMTMAYKLAQPGIASELHPGDRLTARLKVNGSTSVLDQIVVVAQAKPDYKPARLYNTPTAGQSVPDFHFVNQEGRAVSLDQFRGQVVLVTFIYTRCPLPDYCIRMSRNMAEVQKQLQADPGLASHTHLLSISFDPAYDTPKVLRSYGSAYTQSFSRWDFVVPAVADLNRVEEFFDVGVTASRSGALAHSLSTVVIAPDGKIFRWYPSNDWNPSAVAGDVKQSFGPLRSTATEIKRKL